jgi:hypothetical protein
MIGAPDAVRIALSSEDSPPAIDGSLERVLLPFLLRFALGGPLHVDRFTLGVVGELQGLPADAGLG